MQSVLGRFLRFADLLVDFIDVGEHFLIFVKIGGEVAIIFLGFRNVVFHD